MNLTPLEKELVEALSRLLNLCEMEDEQNELLVKTEAKKVANHVIIKALGK